MASRTARKSTLSYPGSLNAAGVTVIYGGFTTPDLYDEDPNQPPANPTPILSDTTAPRRDAAEEHAPLPSLADILEREGVKWRKS